eukprot:TRINITY_DN11778_c0_g1_i1.p1 TRINITY_DN11778_c0_g1~~TRINITY_DN11778_c0_g1_i1.p1  ORF type:complete len:163 (+),score=22.11 TRINITY_DN11778_c0_g1_i1:88-576(+)
MSVSNQCLKWKIDGMVAGEKSFEPCMDGLDIHYEGRFCKARKLKPADLGCAIVDVHSEAIRDATLKYLQEVCQPDLAPTVQICGVSMTVQRQFDTRTGQYIASDIYVAWSHKIEKASPLPLSKIVHAFDRLVYEVTMSLELQHLAPGPADVPTPSFHVFQLQ